MQKIMYTISGHWASVAAAVITTDHNLLRERLNFVEIHPIFIDRRNTDIRIYGQRRTMKNSILVIVLLITITSSPAQKQGLDLIDSLKTDLSRAAEDTGKVRLLGKLSFQYYRYDTDLGIAYGQQAIALAEKLRWETGLAFSYNYLGTNYAVKGNYTKALE